MRPAIAGLFFSFAAYESIVHSFIYQRHGPGKQDRRFSHVSIFRTGRDGGRLAFRAPWQPGSGGSGVDPYGSDGGIPGGEDLSVRPGDLEG
jgi:hypothetical protein